MPPPQSPKVLQVVVDFPEDRPSQPWSIIVQIALPLDPAKKYIKVERSDSSFEKRITPIPSLDSLSNVAEIEFTVTEFAELMGQEEAELSKTK